MRCTTILLLLLLCCRNAAEGQSQSPLHPRFAGCYEVKSLVWNPPDETIRLIPRQFQLLNKTWDDRSQIVFKMKSLPSSGNLMENLWAWAPKGNRVWISWSTGFGGFKGTLKPSRPDELVGKLKEWCDSRCGWKKRTGQILALKIDCSEMADSISSQ
jgi:hypothetical protein